MYNYRVYSYKLFTLLKYPEERINTYGIERSGRFTTAVIAIDKPIRNE